MASDPIEQIAASAPDHIWLDLGEEAHLVEEGTTFKDLAGVTWSEDNATGQGIKYVRATPPAATPAAPGEVTDEQVHASAYKHCFKASEMAPQGEQLYLFDLARIKRLCAALSNPAPVAAPAHPPRVTALDVDNLSQAVGQAEEIDGNLRSIRSRLDALAAPAPASEAEKDANK